MAREERLKFCLICTYKKFDPEQGTICVLTGQQADFEGSCVHFSSVEKDPGEQLVYRGLRDKNGE